MARRKKFPNLIVVRRKAETAEGEARLQTYPTVESALDDAAPGVDIELAIYGLLETRMRRKS